MLYQPYRGVRAQRRRTIRNIIIALLCVFIAACIIFLLFFQNKSTVTLFGVQIDLPWAQHQEPVKKPEPSDNTQKPAEDNATTPPTANVENTQTPPVANPENTQAPPVTTPVAASVPKTVEIPLAQLADVASLAQTAQQLKAKGFTTAAITVKAEDGSITAASILTPAMQALKNAGLQTTAIVYTFQDNGYAKQNNAAALKNIENKVWRLPDGARWLDPASAEAMTYITQKLQACKAAGFDEIQLRGFGWPTQGIIARIQYGNYSTGAARSDLLAQRLQELSTAVSPVPVSVYVDDPTAANGINENSGQSVTKLYSVASKVYVPLAVQTETSGNSIRTIISGYTGGNAEKLIPIYTDTALLPSLLPGSDMFYFTPANGDIRTVLA